MLRSLLTIKCLVPFYQVCIEPFAGRVRHTPHGFRRGQSHVCVVQPLQKILNLHCDILNLQKKQKNKCKGPLWWCAYQLVMAQFSSSIISCHQYLCSILMKHYNSITRKPCFMMIKAKLKCLNLGSPFHNFMFTFTQKKTTRGRHNMPIMKHKKHNFSPLLLLQGWQNNGCSSLFTWLSLFSNSSCLRSVSQRTNSQLSLSCSSWDCRPCGLSTVPTSSSPLPALLRDSIVRTWDMTSFRKTLEREGGAEVRDLSRYK